MPCLRVPAPSRPGAIAFGALLLAAACPGIGMRAGAPSRYRAPSVVLAYPERGAALPADKAFIVLRFAPGEADDPIDVASFKATVDGVDRTPLFHVTNPQAWGPIGDSTTASAAGPHVVAARICSALGACGSLSVAIEVRPWVRALGVNGAAHDVAIPAPNEIPTAPTRAAAIRGGTRGTGA